MEGRMIRLSKNWSGGTRLLSFGNSCQFTWQGEFGNSLHTFFFLVQAFFFLFLMESLFASVTHNPTYHWPPIHLTISMEIVSSFDCSNDLSFNSFFLPSYRCRDNREREERIEATLQTDDERRRVGWRSSSSYETVLGRGSVRETRLSGTEGNHQKTQQVSSGLAQWLSLIWILWRS